jgi:hypothetical protein
MMQKPSDTIFSLKAKKITGLTKKASIFPKLVVPHLSAQE